MSWAAVLGRARLNAVSRLALKGIARSVADNERRSPMEEFYHTAHGTIALESGIEDAAGESTVVPRRA
jgi:hypothetical protein